MVTTTWENSGLMTQIGADDTDLRTQDPAPVRVVGRPGKTPDPGPSRPSWTQVRTAGRVPSGGSGRGHWPACHRPSASWVTTSRTDLPNAVGASSTPSVTQRTTVIFSSNRLRECVV